MNNLGNNSGNVIDEGSSCGSKRTKIDDTGDIDGIESYAAATLSQTVSSSYIHSAY